MVAIVEIRRPQPLADRATPSSWSLRVALCAVLFLLIGAMPAGATEAAPASEWKTSVWPKLQLESPGGAFRLRLGGRLLLDGGGVDYGQGLRLAPSTGWDLEGRVRQARLFVRGRYRFLELMTEVDFSPNHFNPADFSLTSAYVGAREIPWLGRVRFGHQKNPFSLENAMSRKYMVFMERSLVETLTPSLRDTGLLAFNTALGERVRWSIGGFRSTTQNGRSFTEPASYLVTGRLTGLPWWRDQGRSLLQLGLAYSREFSPGTFSASQRPESFLATALVATGQVASVDDIDRIGGEIAWVHGPVSIQSEAVGAVVHRDAGSTLGFWGAYVMVSWFVTGEHRDYLRSSAVFGPVKPRRDFAPWRSMRDWGALQLGARYSHVDLDDGDVRGGIENDLALAVNWFLRSWLRISANYVFGHVEDQGSVNILQMRFQIEY